MNKSELIDSISSASGLTKTDSAKALEAFIASVSNDKSMIDLFETGCGDVHSLVAYMSYPNIIPRSTRIEDIKKLYHEQRQEAKGIE